MRQSHVQSGSLKSRIGLNAANFFLAEMAGVLVPFLGNFLKSHSWRYDAIGLAVSLSWLGQLCFQIPAGIVSDKFAHQRKLLAGATIIFGVGCAAIPFAPDSVWGTDLLLILIGTVSGFFVPLLAALALALAGPKGFDRMMGVNQGWNHAGNIAAGLVALYLVKTAGVTSVFYVMAFVSFLTAGALMMMRAEDLQPKPEEEATLRSHSFSSLYKDLKTLLRQRAILSLIVSIALFHIANAPAMPLVALYLKSLGAADDKTAWVILIAQAVMVPVALLCGYFCPRFGRKPVLAIAFLVLPVRMVLYSMTTNPTLLLSIQALDGIGMGIYTVVVCLMCADLTRGKAGFNTLLATCTAALAFGGFIGPLVQGWVTQHMGFPAAFITLAGIAVLGTLTFLTQVPETKPGDRSLRRKAGVDDGDMITPPVAAP